MIDGSENVIISWLLNFIIRVFLKSAVIIGLISIELGCMISMTRCLIRYVAYTGNSLLASTECICKHNVIVTAV